MTAIIGFTCFDSVLMMADTEESTTKGNQRLRPYFIEEPE